MSEIQIDQVSRTYAKAAFDLASEVSKVQQLVSGLESVAIACSESKELQKLIEAASFSAIEKKLVVAELCQRLGVDSLVKNFCDLLVEKRRFSLVSSIVLALRVMVDASSGRVRGVVEAVDSLSDAEMQGLEKAFSKKLGKDVALNQKQNKSLLGGLVVRVSGLTFDGSLRTSLDRMRDTLERQSV